jgi:hypothetical protein
VPLAGRIFMGIAEQVGHNLRQPVTVGADQRQILR